jgi:hypothetical protein
MGWIHDQKKKAGESMNIALQYALYLEIEFATQK